MTDNIIVPVEEIVLKYLNLNGLELAVNDRLEALNPVAQGPVYDTSREANTFSAEEANVLSQLAYFSFSKESFYEVDDQDNSRYKTLQEAATALYMFLNCSFIQQICNTCKKFGMP